MKNSMKTSKLFIVLSLLLTLGSTIVHANDPGPLRLQSEDEIRTTLERCLIRTYGLQADGGRVLGPYLSTCAGLVRQGRTAFVPMSVEAGAERGWEIRLIGSEYSDGGDLWDVAVWDEKGHLLLEAERVLAFGDAFEAVAILTGAEPQASLHDPELDEQR
jgi:hypothetical protein